MSFWVQGNGRLPCLPGGVGALPPPRSRGAPGLSQKPVNENYGQKRHSPLQNSGHSQLYHKVQAPPSTIHGPALQKLLQMSLGAGGQVPSDADCVHVTYSMDRHWALPSELCSEPLASNPSHAPPLWPGKRLSALRSSLIARKGSHAKPEPLAMLSLLRGPRTLKQTSMGPWTRLGIGPGQPSARPWSGVTPPVPCPERKEEPV